MNRDAPTRDTDPLHVAVTVLVFALVVGGSYLYVSRQLVTGLIASGAADAMAPSPSIRDVPRTRRDTGQAPGELWATDATSARADDRGAGGVSRDGRAGRAVRGTNRTDDVLRQKRRGPPPAAPPSPGRPDAVDRADGRLDRSAVRRAMEAFEPAARDCYRSVLDDFPSASGTVAIDFRIVADGGRGRVEMSRLDRDSTSLYHRRLHDCLLERVGDLDVPAPATEETVNVTYPINFQNRRSGRDTQP